MASRDSGGFSFTWFILLFIFFNYFVFDDNDDKKEIDIKDQSITVVEETTQKKGIDISKLQKEGADVVNQIINRVKEEVTSNEKKSEPEEKPEKNDGPVMTAESEEVKQETKPVINNNPKDTGMKKL